MNGSTNTGTGAILPAALIAFGLIVGGWTLGSQIKATRLSDRYVAVKGLVERTVKSDLAIWPLSYKEAGNELSSVYAKTDADKQRILKFLSDQGIQNSDRKSTRLNSSHSGEYRMPSSA